MDALLLPFKSWLQARHYQPATIRNYLVDIRKYLSSVSSANPFSPSSLSQFLSQLTGSLNEKRSLASLSKFCQYALDQKLISQNPFTKIRKQHHLSGQNPSHTTPTDLIVQYQSYLLAQKFNSVTIKNYINDIQQYLNWVNDQTEN